MGIWWSGTIRWGSRKWAAYGGRDIQNAAVGKRKMTKSFPTVTKFTMYANCAKQKNLVASLRDGLFICSCASLFYFLLLDCSKNVPPPQVAEFFALSFRSGDKGYVWPTHNCMFCWSNQLSFSIKRFKQNGLHICRARHRKPERRLASHPPPLGQEAALWTGWCVAGDWTQVGAMQVLGWQKSAWMQGGP